MSDFNPFAESGGAAIKFPSVGDETTIMIDNYKLLDNQFKPGEKVAVIEGRTSDGESRTLWCDKNGLVKAIGAAMREAGHDGPPTAGAVLKITRTEDGVSQTPGHANPHRFTAHYTPGTAPAPAEEKPEPEPAPDPSTFFQTS